MQVVYVNCNVHTKRTNLGFQSKINVWCFNFAYCWRMILCDPLLLLLLHIPGVQARNDDFTQQMVHQRAVCAIKIWHCAFFVSSTSVRRARVINWKSVCIVWCSCVQYIEIYTEQRAFADGINFLFSFEENCCWIISITSRSLWWTYSIARYVWTIVSAFQKWWLRQIGRASCRERV